MDQGYEDHLITQKADIPEVDRVQWRKIDAQLYCSLKEEFLTVMPLTLDVGAQQTQLDKFFMVLTLIGLRLDLEPVRDQILGSSSVPSLDDVFARLLRISSTQTFPFDSTSDSSVLVSHTTSRGGRSGNRGRGQRSHCTYCNKLGHTRDRCYQLHWAASSHCPCGPPGNASACLTHTSSLGPWILDSGASDHLSAKGIGLTLPLPSLPLTSDRSMGKTIGIGRESQGLYHLTSDSSPVVCISTDAPLLIHNRLGHPSLSKFQKMVPRFSTLSSLPCESCQLGKHTRVSFPKRLSNRAKSPFELVHTDVWGPCRTASTLGFQYFVTFIHDYSRSPFTSFMSHHGILHQSSCAHTPQQNGVAERKNRHLVETARTILLHSNVPFRFWGDAVLTACYLINRMPSSVLHDQIPHSLLFPDQPLYFLPPRVFGCTCFVHILTPGQDKLSAKAMKCLFLGYSRLQKGYRCYSLETHRYFISADVTFFEDSPFFSTTSESLPVSEVLPIPIVSPPDAMPPRPLQVYHRRPRVVAPLPFAEAPADSLPIPSASPAPALPSPNDLPIAVRKGTRSTRNPHPIYNFLSYHRLSSPYSAFVSAISSVSLPKSTHEALSHPGWRQAMVDEMAALHSNGTWDLVVLPSGKSTVGCRWVYAVKVGPDGQVDRLKARLVAKGYTQVYGSDYGDTFSPVAKIASVRASLHGCYWPLYQLDIKNAFLHGDLAEEVYMEQPPGFVAQGESGLVCRLRRSLYGLKQSPRAWFTVLVLLFKSLACFAVQQTIQFSIIITPWGSTKDLGKLKYFLGIEIAQSSSGVVLSQRKYALDILEETGMLDCKPVDTPMDPNVKLVPGQGEPLGDLGRYRRLVSRCDSHWDVVIRILRYIKSTPGQEQDVVARSSAEAEYRAMALATCELIWLRHLLRELRFGKDKQMKLICDNQAALHIASNPVFHERTKHIEVDCHFIREKIASRCVATSFVNSNDQLADIFTKSLRDIKNAFLHRDLAEEVYMEQSPGFVAQGESGLVCRLRRSLYGLKQSPRAWFSRFSSVVQEFGIFAVQQTIPFSIIITLRAVYLSGSLCGRHRHYKQIEIAQSSSSVVLSERKYALDILEETGQGEPLGDPGRYWRLVGKLNYLTITRPDISFLVSVVSQFLQSSCDSHWDAVICILRYVKSTPGQGVLYENRGHTQVVGYTDADWAGSPTDRRSTSGYCVFIGGGEKLLETLGDIHT
ncbi:Retrovirus-related Pol polyprotein from transposon TNT 1-94 [Vitis vinifera]|uniref:Retrovirus-related Pol polyprotein from transposon TNT 1-94 n=1 Tax=Vitis vinifera TaxID=29760 RepID=A0A438BWN9_VITVI|nr:Retrovirus-related Pol polyprotein from transposon TNT 1-94 [Vitis vinifera]